MLTASEILKEYTKCLIDPIHAIETYLETFDKTQEGFVPFKLFYKQKEIVNAYKNHRFNIITKPRQAGVSTTTAAYLAIQVALADKDNPESILILANKQDMAQEFLSKVKDFLLQLPRWFWGYEYYGTPQNEAKNIFLTESKKELMLPNKSRVKAVATSKDALRGYTPTYLVMDEAAFIDNGIEVFGAALTALGCLTEDSLILTEDGLVEMGDLVIEKNKLGFTKLDKPYSIVNKFGKIEKATETYVSEYSETYKIETEYGYSIEGSWKHPLLVNRNGEEEWVKLNELTENDELILTYNQNVYGDYNIVNYNYNKHPNSDNINIPDNLSDNLDFCYLLGLYTAEGNFSKSGIQITNSDDYITNLLTTDGIGLGKPFIKIRKNHYEISSIELKTYLKHLGFTEGHSSNKSIPKAILRASKEVIVNYLQGLFDGDGSATKKDIKYFTISKKLATQLQILLLNMGIISSLSYKEQETSKTSIIENKDHITKIYELKIYGKHALKFYNEIGFRLKRKQNRVNLIKNNKDIKRFINVKKEDIISILNDNNIPRYKVRFLDRLFTDNTNKISYHSLDRLNSICTIITPKLLELNRRRLLGQSKVLVKVKKITKSEGYTYDLHVPKTNSFISNGFISHNTGGRATLISTPNGQDPLYYETYEQAKQGKNNFNVIEMKWYEDPRYNKDLRWYKDVSVEGKEEKEVIMEYEVEFTKESYEKRIKDGWKPRSFWYEEMCKGMNNNARMIAQELDVSFLGSGGNVIGDEYIEHQEKFNVRDPKWVHGEEDEFWIWEKPVEGHRYIMGVDVARGDGADASTIVIVDMDTMEQVMEYQGKIQPDLLAEIVEEYGELYNAYAVVDITGGMGVTTVLKLVESNYKNLHYDDRKKLIGKNKDFEGYTKSGDLIPGFNANGVRLPMIAHLEYMIRTNQIKVRSRRMTSEMRTFIYKNGRPDHSEGKHDDLLMALAMALFTLEHSFKKLEKLESKTKAMLDAWVMVGNDTVFDEENNNNGFVSKANRKKKAQPKPNFSNIVKKNMQDPNGNYMWLFSGMK